MKKYKYFIIGLAFILSVSCRTVKQRSEEVQRELRLESQASAWASSAYDSTGHHWFLQTDSPFYYHPDRGLFAYGGNLALAEAQVIKQNVLQIDSSTGYDLNEQSQSNYSVNPAASSKLSYWLWGGAALLLLFWWAKRRLRRLRG